MDEDLRDYYVSGVELSRLATDDGVLELVRTQELLSRYLAPRSRVLDVGGGPGVYAEWLADRGHEVLLLDPIPVHLDEARRRAGDPPAFSVLEGDARRLPLEDTSFDAVLLLGPIYHLGERHDRLVALAEARRVSRRGGLVLVAAISRYAPLLRVLRSGQLRDEKVFANVQCELVSGRRVPPERRQGPFPDGFFHLPEELGDEIVEAGLELEAIFGIEGPGWLLGDFLQHWGDDVLRERILWAARAIEADARLLAISAHLLAVARRD
jgi:SAM-dependent methyltransferase